ncbi:MAG: NAD-dependent epimerase/dehydratase family protein [Vicinamibacterales bacterium]
MSRVLVTGGGGYVGSALVPRLLERGHQVRVVDLFWYGREVFGGALRHPALELAEVDIRDTARVKPLLAGVDTVIHLACISNDPSFELDPELGKSINYDAFQSLVDGAVEHGVRRFIYASSSSVYGIKEVPNVTEDAAPEPLTDYSRFKLLCEHDLLAHPNPGGMTRVVARPATVCGYAPRLRLDLTVNILTIHALVNRRIRVFGGSQLRPNLHVADMVRGYECLMDAPAHLIDGQAFNIGFENRSVADIAALVRSTLGDAGVEIETTPSDDLRSYHINADKVRDVLGFVPCHTIADAIRSIADAYRAGAIPDPLTRLAYYNLKTMKALQVA